MPDPDYFTIAEFRGLPDMSSATTYPDARVLSVAAHVTAVIERHVGTSFVARSYTETYDGGDASILLRNPPIISVTSVTENGVAITDSITSTDGVLEHKASTNYGSPQTWLTGRRNITVSYTAGYSATPPADIKEAAMQATRYRLLTTAATSSLTDRATSLTNEFGNVALSTATPDTPFGLPEVDSVVNGWRDRIDVYGFA